MTPSKPVQRRVLVGAIATIIACVLATIVLVLVGVPGALEEQVLFSLFFTGVTSVLSLFTITAWFRRVRHPLGLLATGALAINLGLSLFVVLAFDATRPIGTWTELAFGMMWLLACELTYLSILALARLHKNYEWLRRTFVAASLVLTAILGVIISGETLNGWWERLIDTSISWRVIACLGIVAASGLVVIPILHYVSGMTTREPVNVAALVVDLICPRCACRQELPAGASACRQCRLKFTIQIDEDQCSQCGYPLYQLQSTNCPECGAKVI